MQHLTVALTDQDLTLEHKQGEYYLDTHVEFQQVVALSHLLLASGAFPPAEMKSIMTTLLNHFAGSERHRLKQALAHDVEAYLPYNREVPLLEMIGTLTDAITEQKAVTFTYRSRRSLTRVKLNRRHTGKPGALFVNNNRFYVALFEHETQRADHYYLYRLDRIVKIEKPRVNLSLKPGRFDLQAYRQHNYLLFDSEHVRVHLLYQDYPQTLKEAFPTAQQLKKYPDEENRWEFVIPDVSYDGIKLWALSAGSKVTILSPARLAEAIRDEALKVVNLYKNN